MSLNNRTIEQISQLREVALEANHSPSSFVAKNALSDIPFHIEDGAKGCDDLRSDEPSVGCVADGHDDDEDPEEQHGGDEPIPKAKILAIIATQLLSSAPTIMFAAMNPYIYAFLVGDYQTAGTVSSIVTGVVMCVQVVLTPVMSQVMDMYGRRALALLAAGKALVVVLPLMAAGCIIAAYADADNFGSPGHVNPATNATTIPSDAKAVDIKLGRYITDTAAHALLQVCYILYWLLLAVSNATATSFAVVAIGDVCPTQSARSSAIGMYAGFSYLLAGAAVIGAQLPLVAAGIVAAAVAVCGVVWSILRMPETISLAGVGDDDVVVATRYGSVTDESRAPHTCEGGDGVASTQQDEDRRVASTCSPVPSDKFSSCRSTATNRRVCLDTTTSAAALATSKEELATLNNFATPSPSLSEADGSTKNRSRTHSVAVVQNAQRISSSTRRRRLSIYPIQISGSGASSDDATAPTIACPATAKRETSARPSPVNPVRTAPLSVVAGPEEHASPQPPPHHPGSVAPPGGTTQRPSLEARRIRVCVNPMKGLDLITQTRTTTVALLVLFSCLMAEVSASDTLVYYLAITLDFSPAETSYMQIEQAMLSVVCCGIIGPFLSARLRCASLCLICSFFIAVALCVLALANSATVVYAVYVPCISIASIMMPSLAAIITRDATTPSTVSLAMGTVMAIVALLQAGASFLVALVFKSLPREYLWVTFLIAAAFTVPMFCFSLYLGRLTGREEDAADKALVSSPEGSAACGAVDKSPLLASEDGSLTVQK